MMPESPQQNELRDSTDENRRSGQPRWFWAVLVAMLLAFGVVLLERNVIRSYWWAHRLAQCDDFEQQAYYINALLNVDEAADGAVLKMARNERSEVRAAAILILGQGANPEKMTALVDLLGDADLEVRESAARTLAFLNRADTQTLLIDMVASDNADAAAAAAVGLSRLDSRDAICALCRAIATHSDSLVRAQAVESLGAVLMSSPDALATISGRDCDPIAVLVEALRDRGGYKGTLSLEREINAARGAAATGNAAGSIVAEVTSTSPPFCVSNVVRQTIARLLGKPFETPIPETPEAAAELADSLRRRIADRGVRFELPTSLPVLHPLQP